MAFWNRKDSTEAQHQDTIHAIEEVVAEQHLTYTYDNDGFTIHTPSGNDPSFDWKEHGGLEHTLQWLKKQANG